MEPTPTALHRAVLAATVAALPTTSGTDATALQSSIWRAIRSRLHGGARRGDGLPVSTTSPTPTTLRARDTDAWDSLLETALPKLLGFARRQLGDPASAEDAVQQALIEAFGRAEEMPDSSTPLAWLLGFVRNTALREQRRRARRSSEPLPDDLEDQPFDPASFLDQAEQEQRLAAAIAELEVLDQEIVLARINGRSDQEIAAAHDLSVGNVQVRRHRALRALRARLGIAP